MTNKAGGRGDARRLEKLYGTKAHGTSYQTVLNLVRERGLDGAIKQLEEWGMKPQTTEPMNIPDFVREKLPKVGDRVVYTSASGHRYDGTVDAIPNNPGHAYTPFPTVSLSFRDERNKLIRKSRVLPWTGCGSNRQKYAVNAFLPCGLVVECVECGSLTHSTCNK